MPLPRPCLDCGFNTAAGSRCPDCEAKRQKARDARRGSSSARGYDSQWQRVSRAARRLVGHCEDCGTTDDLTADHSPEAWAAKEAGQPVTLDMVRAVVCRPCNAKRGKARVGGTPDQGGTRPQGQAGFQTLTTGGPA